MYFILSKYRFNPLDQAGVQESIAADILGHEKKTITYGLYSEGSSMTQKIEAIEKINYQYNQ